MTAMPRGTLALMRQVLPDATTQGESEHTTPRLLRLEGSRCLQGCCRREREMRIRDAGYLRLNGPVLSGRFVRWNGEQPTDVCGEERR